MRVACVVVAVLALPCAEARADVFVPSDPPALRSAQCGAAAGDVIAAGNYGAKVRVSVGGGGWHELPGVSGCPVVAGAADGTLAIAGTGDNSTDAGSSLVVRGAGGAFGAPIALGDRSASEPVVAAAPGGWIAAAWSASDVGLTVLVLRPDGTSARAVLDPTTNAPDSPRVSDEQVGIDAGGNVTVLWRRYGDDTERLRVARGTGGASPGAGVDVPTGSEDLHGVALSVAPGGGTLIGWATESGVRAVVDGQPPQLVDGTARSAARVAAAIADDGTALLAYPGQGDETVAVERVAGSWLGPRLLAAGAAAETPSYDRAALDIQQRLVATVAPGGRAVVAWSDAPDRELKVFAVSGQVGGTWAGAARVSAITRIASVPSLAPDATGAPRVVWTEAGLGVRGAALAPAPLDTSAPVVAARFPSRLAPTVDGNVVVAVRVRCSEACDARAGLELTSAQRNAIEGGPEDGGGSVAGALPAGRDTVLRLRVSDWLQYALVVDPGSRLLRVQLLVTDRAGNVVRRTVTRRVRLLKPPVRTFKVALGHRFWMETPAGNRAVARLVNGIIDAVARGHVSDETLARRYTRGLKAIARKFGTDSTYSQDVESEIYDALWLPFARTGHDTGSILSG